MARTRTRFAFTVAHAGISLRVRLLPGVADVDREYRAGRRRRDRQTVHGYFQPSASATARHQGVIVLGMDSNLDEIVPHEVVHAVVHCLRGVSATHDEGAATAVGVLSAQIFSRARACAART
ncbi:Uncharacterised protein [Bordetella ansorpii]|uniref:Uncharacterized protein n=1 Tax=Bordetella ansorpii TaxID=288768 RepID=A0A157SW76_9BORD|nr:hypothetical protein [Bordetella ansorpii]SAI74594.1 Uncharacterised protein [Bordetella ansorpii]